MKRRLIRATTVLAGLFAFGTIGYRIVGSPTWWDAFYMTVITLTTVGYDEVFPLTQAGELFTVVLLLAGLGVFFYMATDIGRSIVEIELREVLGVARRSRMIDRLTNHEIVCGWGRMGQAVVAELRRDGRSVVVVELSPERVAELNKLGIPAVLGDAGAEATLKAAGVERARGLISCLADDAHNVYAVLTARSLNASLAIVARASEPGAERRLVRAGANRVVNPYHLGGVRLAQLLVRPTVMEFLDSSLSGAGNELGIDQIPLSERSPLAGTSIEDAALRRRFGIAVVAVHRDSRLVPNPDPSFRFDVGDVIVALGRPGQLVQFEHWVSPGGRTGPVASTS